MKNPFKKRGFIRFLELTLEAALLLASLYLIFLLHSLPRIWGLE